MAQTATPTADRPHKATKRYIYSWGDGRAEGNAQMRDLLGGKGAGLAEMTALGIPVPAGFTVTTAACVEYMRAGQEYPDGLEAEIDEHLRRLEEQAGKRFGDPEDPLLVSVRSGAAVSMPGMMDTILNLGLTKDEVESSPEYDECQGVENEQGELLELYYNGLLHGRPHVRAA